MYGSSTLNHYSEVDGKMEIDPLIKDDQAIILSIKNKGLVVITGCGIINILKNSSSGFKATHATQYYSERAKLRRRKYIKLWLAAEVLQQIICTIKIRRATSRHDNIDFGPLITKTSEILPLSVVIGDKAYDSEVNHILVRDVFHALSVIPARYEYVSIRNTQGKYRKLMKRGYSKSLYSQRNKDETIVSVIKRLFGEHITSRLVKTQNRELSFRCIAYNIHRLTNIRHIA